MTTMEFNAEMGRLIQQYGVASYSEARIKVIANEVKDFDVKWWRKAVDKFLGECRYAPLIPDIREAAALERERMYYTRKQEQSKQAEEFMDSYSKETKRTICKEIIDVIKGNKPEGLV